MMCLELLIAFLPPTSDFLSSDYLTILASGVELAWKDVNKGEIKHYGSMDAIQYQMVLDSLSGTDSDPIQSV
jgi:hypothetical protein